MSRAIILTVDDDPAVSQAITRDLRSRYGDRYRIVRSTSGAEALSTLEEFARRDQPVALIVSDHRMPEMTGIELLGRSKALAPGAKLVLLTAYADTDVAIKAINDIGLDHYLMKPWAPPEERLFPVLDDLLDRLGAREQPPLRRRAGRRQPLVGTQLRHADVPRPQPRALPVAGARARRRGPAPARACSAPPTHELPLVLLPDGDGAARAPACASSPTRSGCGRAPSRRSTTSSSSAPARPAWRRRCTARRRACAPR